MAWAYGRGEPVTLHLTADKMRGGQFNNKPESWLEIVALFPAGSVVLQYHDICPRSEVLWLSYLRDKGIDARAYHYGDQAGPDLDISEYLQDFPLLTAEAVDVSLPEQFVTVQWDSNGAGRTLAAALRSEVLKNYGETVMVGGDAKGSFRWSLKNIAYAMSKADLHVGVDSGFLHLAQLYMPATRIHLYSQLQSRSIHALGVVNKGAKLNAFLRDNTGRA